MKEIQDDENFKVFYSKFEILKVVADSQEQLKEISAEADYGNTEYKLKLDNPSLDRVDHLTTQMIWRLNEGFGHAYYRIGVEDNGVVSGISV
jgi:GTPase